MATNKELGAELTRRLRRLLGPTEAGPHGDAERYLGTMPRRNEPAGDFVHPETPVSEESLRRMAARPAEQFNMNAASAAGGRIKGIEGIAIEIDPDLAVTTFRKQTSENSRPTARSVAAGMLYESRRTRAALCTTLQGPGWAGSRRGWIEPGEAATAMTVALRNTDRSADGQANAWKHVSREQIQERSNGEDYDGYINALAEDTVPAGGGEDTETHAGAVRDAERAIEQQLGATIIEPGADVSTKAVIGRNVRIGTGTRVEADAHVGCTTGGLGTAVKNDESARRPTVVGEHARIGRKATVAAGARIGNRTAIGAYARVHSVGHDSRVGSDAWCRGPVGNETSIGRNAITHQVGNGCEIGEGAGVRRPVGNDVHVGRDTGIGLTVGHDNQERVPDGSRTGPEVHAPHGFRTVGNGAAQIAGGAHMGKGLTIPSGTAVGGNIESMADVAREIEASGKTKPKIGRGCSIHATAEIRAGAELGDGVEVEAGATIGYGARIGAGARIQERASIETCANVGTGTQVGAGATIREGSELTDGVEVDAGTWVGQNARIGKNSRIGGTVRDRVTTEDGVTIGKGTLVDPRVRIGAGTEIGEGAEIGCDARIGAGATIGAGARVGQRTTVGHRARVEANAELGYGEVIESGEVVRRGQGSKNSRAAEPAPAPRSATAETGARNRGERAGAER